MSLVCCFRAEREKARPETSAPQGGERERPKRPKPQGWRASQIPDTGPNKVRPRNGG